MSVALVLVVMRTANAPAQRLRRQATWNETERENQQPARNGRCDNL
jgi:hypothetical protein